MSLRSLAVWMAVWMAGCVLASAAVGAGPPELLPSAGAAPATRAAAPPPATHGWFVTVDPQGQAVLAHVPPRRRSGADGQLRGTGDGVVHKAIGLDAEPRALAAWDDRVYLVFNAGAGGSRAVGSLSARPTPVRDRWRYEPDGRLAVEPSLTGAGDLVGFAASAMGVGAMIVDATPGGAPYRRFFVLDGRAWREVDLPKALRSPVAGDTAWLISTGDGLGVFRRLGDGSAELWVASKATEPPRGSIASRSPGGELFGDSGGAGGQDPPLTLVWTRRELAADRGLPAMPHGGALVFMSGERVYASVVNGGGGLDVFAVTPGTSVRVGKIEKVGPMVGVVGMDTPSRLVAAWFVPEVPGGTRRGEPGKAEARVEVRELSLVDGRTEFSGPMKGDTPLSPREVQWLALGLVVLMGAVLLVVLRSDPSEDAYTIPPRTSLAPSGRRMVAGVIDLLTAGVVAARLLGIAIPELGDPEFVVSERSLIFAGVMVVSGLVLGVMGEVLIGRSIGKLLTGCEVVDVRVTGSISHPQFWQALVRNVIKWVLAPAAMLGLMDAQGRHRGDSMSRTAVVVEEPDEDPEGLGDE